MPKLSRNDLWLGIVSFLNDLSSEMIFPVLPIYFASVLYFNKGTIGLIEGLGAAAALILQGLSGYLSDRLRRRKQIVVAGYALSTIVKPLFAAVVAPWHAVILRMTDRAGKGIRNAPRDALISDTTAPAVRGIAYGFNRMMDTSGAVLGSLFAFAFLALYPGQFTTIFKIAFIPGVVAVVALALFVRDAPGKIIRRVFEWKKVSRSAKYFFVVSAIFALANASYAFFLLRASGLGVSDKFIPLLYIVYSIFAAAFFVPIGKWTDTAGRSRALIAGYVLFAAVAYFFTTTNTTALWILFALYGIAVALTDGVSRALVADLTHPAVHGTAFGIYFTMQGVAAFAASFIFGRLWDAISPTAPFIVSSLLSLAAAGAFLWFLYKHRGHGHFGESVSPEYRPNR